MRKFSLGLLKQADFRNFWLGHTISMFGVQITLVALPLVAAINLGATPLQMGILQAVEFLPYIIISLFAGVWVDRKPKRPILIITDILRALLLLGIPLGIYLDLLSMPLLFLIAGLVGINTVFFDISHTSYLPFMVRREDLVEGNSKLEFSSSSATTVGQSIGGALIQIFSAPFAIFFNVGTYLLSAIFLSLIKTKELPIEKRPEEQNVWAEIREGTSFVFGNQVIRTLLMATMIFNLFTYVIEPIFILYITRTLKLEPIYIGFIFSMSGVGALLGAMIASSFAKKLGIGRALVASLLIAGVVSFLIPFATFLPLLPAVILIMTMYMIDAAMVIVFNIIQRSLRTSITPDYLQGRMNASIRLFVMGVVPVGSLLGGWLGGMIGTTSTLIVGAIGIMCSSVFILLSTVRTLRQPEEIVPKVEE
ncbi:MFS transporter [Thermoflavimicrobium daqui]|uniref:MFS transporter n=1 Tax=Thermoflavimicrobium daqui TaxID=2137476 RepID=A0A364K444_9BACL|nr:MFS transporter [Thermoflavimicrobium daqui]RAL24061.1 MFS transporter [Thermoflavimicrobium daqui]